MVARDYGRVHVKRRNDVDNNGERGRARLARDEERKCNSYHFLYFPFDFLQMQFHWKEISAQCNPSASLNTVLPLMK